MTIDSTNELATEWVETAPLGGGWWVALRAAVAGAFASLVVAVASTPAWGQAPNPPPAPPPGLDSAANTFLGWMKWGGLVAGVLGLFICGVMMMVGRRNRSTAAVDGATGIPWVLGGLTVMSFAAGIVGQVLS